MFIKHILPSFAWAIFIIILSGLSSDHFVETNFHFDKVIHFIEYSALSLIMSIGLKRQYSFPKIRSNAFKISISFSILYGGIIELTQILFFNGREGDLLDILANSLGALFGYVLFKIIYGNTIMQAS